MAGKIDFQRIKTAALNDARRIVEAWAPGGRYEGAEYSALNPRRADHAAGSFKVNVVKGVWRDFASEEGGGDLVSLVAYLDGVSQAEAARALARFLGIPEAAGADPTPPMGTPRPGQPDARPAPSEAPRPEWRPLLPVPDEAPPPPVGHPKRGRPAIRHQYRDGQGRLVFVVDRHEAAPPQFERKTFLQLTYCQNPQGRREWRWQAPEAPRPLYGLDRLAAHPPALVILCEGEKAADAAAILAPDAVAMTWPGGSQAVRKADFSALKGRSVTLWPDADDPGRAAMATAAGLIRESGAASVRTLRPDALTEPGGELPKGWDAADALADGWTPERLATALARSEAFEAGAPEREEAKPAKPGSKDKRRAASTRPPEFIVDDGGVHVIRQGPDGDFLPPEWICSRLDVTARTRSEDGDSWGRLLEFKDDDGTLHRWAMPMEMLRGDGLDYRGELLRLGLQIAPGPRAKDALHRYLLTAPTEHRARCTDRTGWHGRAWVCPDYVMGEAAAGERVIFQSDTVRHAHFRQRGSLDDWRREIAARCVGNSRLVFAVSASFAGPLLAFLGLEGGGFHFRGDSSCGKTTGLQAGRSVWGGPEFLQRWRTTDNALEAIAQQHSDCCLYLDELAQLDPRSAGEAAYLLGNGSGKARAGRMGGLRARQSWRLIYLSAGEIDLGGHMAQAGKEQTAGQAVRHLDIPADAGAGLGAFETLHDAVDGADLSRLINEAARSHYGTAGPTFLTFLVEKFDALPGALRRAQDAFMSAAKLPEGASGQVIRAAQRFALVAAAGELAGAAQVTGWPKGAANAAAQRCLAAWVEGRGGSAPQEEMNLLRQVRRFFEMHAESRFTDYGRADREDDHAPRTMLRAGWKKEIRNAITEKVEDLVFLVMPEVFKAEMTTGFAPKWAAVTLARHGWIKPESESRLDRKESVPALGQKATKRVFVFTSKALGYELGDA
ncbi:MAG: DUF927 domain-containing protein [Zoogloeaceae bacterium]|nr:DUF927 domain-containing protein [Zoogloeaceae bacterium]